MVVSNYKKVAGIRPLYLKSYVIQAMADKHSQPAKRGIDEIFVFEIPKSVFRDQRISDLDMRFGDYRFN